MRALFTFIAGCYLVIASAAHAQSIPLDDPHIEDAAPYLGTYDLGMYGHSLEMPAAHYNEGIARANAIVPLDANGNPDPVNGRIIVMSIGMSNTASEWCNLDGNIPVILNPQGIVACYGWTGMGRFRNPGESNAVNPMLEPVHGAYPAQSAFAWIDDNIGPLAFNPANPALPALYGNYRRLRDYFFPYYTPVVTEAQVQVVWLKELNPAPTVALPDVQADAYILEQELGDIVRFAKTRYPNLKQVFMTSAAARHYNINGFGREPMGYESGLAVKWLIDAQINQVANGGAIADVNAGDLDYTTGAAPWLAWGPYWWADGLTSRQSDGLAWEIHEYLNIDYVHLDQPGASKTGVMLHNFFTFSPFTHCWFVGEGSCS